jgi:ABC-type enterochelin transport system ATPase subunit
MSEWIPADNRLSKITLTVDSPETLDHILFDITLAHLQMFNIQLLIESSDLDFKHSRDLWHALKDVASSLRSISLAMNMAPQGTYRDSIMAMFQGALNENTLELHDAPQQTNLSNDMWPRPI